MHTVKILLVELHYGLKFKRFKIVSGTLVLNTVEGFTEEDYVSVA